MLPQERAKHLADFHAMVARRPVAPIAKGKPCLHLGQPTGELVECKTCSGRVQLKVFECSKFGRCTPAKKVDGVACCDGGKCKEFTR